MSISVITPFFNRAHLIQRLIGTIENQTVQPIEIIIVDDCSTDDTETAVRDAASPVPIVYTRLEKNGGGAIARNAGIELAKGDYVAFLDSDDEWDPDHLQTLLERARSAAGDFVIASRARIVPGGRVMPRGEFPKHGSAADQMYFVLSGGLAFQTSTLLMPRATASRHKFDGRLRRHQDWDLIFRLIREKVELNLLPSVSTKYHAPAGTNLSLSRSLMPSLRFMARHRGAMSRKTISRFVALEIDRRKPRHLKAAASLFKAWLCRGISTKEFVFYLMERFKRAIAGR